MKITLPDNLKATLDDATYKALKDLIKKAFSKVEQTENGFVYTVDFTKEP